MIDIVYHFTVGKKSSVVQLVTEEKAPELSPPAELEQVLKLFASAIADEWLRLKAAHAAEGEPNDLQENIDKEVL